MPDNPPTRSLTDQRGWLGIPYAVYALACFALALLWVVIWPEGKATALDGLPLLALRWGHALAWVFLGLSCLAATLRLPRLTGPFGLAAGAAYAAFVYSLVTAG